MRKCNILHLLNKRKLRYFVSNDRKGRAIRIKILDERKRKSLDPNVILFGKLLGPKKKNGFVLFPKGLD